MLNIKDRIGIVVDTKNNNNNNHLIITTKLIYIKKFPIKNRYS